MAERGKMAELMKKAYEGFVKLCENDEEIRRIRCELDESSVVTGELNIGTYTERAAAYESDIKDLDRKIDQNKKDLEALRKDLERLEAEAPVSDVEQKAKAIRDETNRNLDRQRDARDIEKQSIDNEQNARLAQTKQAYEEQVQAHRDSTRIVHEDEYSEKALAFATRGLQINEDCELSIANENGIIADAAEKRDKTVEKLTREYNETLAAYQPKLDALQKKIDAVINRYRGELEEREDALHSAIHAQEAELEDITRAMLQREAVYDNELESLRASFAQTDRDFSNQIRQAERENRPTTQLNNRRVSQLNKIKMEAEKTERKRDAEMERSQ